MAVDTNVNITPVAGMPPLTTESSGVSSSTSTERVKPTAASAAANVEAAQAGQGVVAKQDELAKTIATSGEAEAQASDFVATQAQEAVADTQKLIDAKKPFIDQAKREAQEAERRFESFTFTDPWANKSTGDRIEARLAIAITDFSNAMLGIRGNEVWDRIKADIDRDFEKQKIALHSKEQMAKWKRDGVKDMYDELQKELAALQIKQAKAKEVVAAKAEAMAKRAGVPEEVAKQNVVTAKANVDAAKDRQASEQRYEARASANQGKTSGVQVTSAKDTTTKGGIESDTKAAQFDILAHHGEKLAEQMDKLTSADVKAINTAASLADTLKEMPTLSAIAAKIGVDEETGLSPRAKAFIADLGPAYQAIGRLESGAAIGKGEGVDFKKKFLPRVSDSPEDLTNRAKNIRTDVGFWRGHIAKAPKTATPGTLPTVQTSANAVSSGTAAEIPKGAKQGRDRRTNKRGYILNGKFTALE